MWQFAHKINLLVQFLASKLNHLWSHGDSWIEKIKIGGSYVKFMFVAVYKVRNLFSYNLVLLLTFSVINRLLSEYFKE